MTSWSKQIRKRKSELVMISQSPKIYLQGVRNPMIVLKIEIDGVTMAVIINLEIRVEIDTDPQVETDNNDHEVEIDIVPTAGTGIDPRVGIATDHHIGIVA